MRAKRTAARLARAATGAPGRCAARARPVFAPPWPAVPAWLLLLCMVWPAGCSDGARVAIRGPDGRRRAVVKVEVADTPAARQVGLMFRRSLAGDGGMLFVFPTEQKLYFWMYNTGIPLDMIFADAQGRVVGVVPDAEPFSRRLLGVDVPAKYVLEVNAGFSRRHGIKAGDRLQFVDFTPLARG